MPARADSSAVKDSPATAWLRVAAMSAEQRPTTQKASSTDAIIASISVNPRFALVVRIGDPVAIVPGEIGNDLLRLGVVDPANGGTARLVRLRHVLIRVVNVDAAL